MTSPPATQAHDLPPDIEFNPVEDFNKLDIDPRVLSGIRDCSFTHPTPIQAKSLPYTLLGYDLIGQAQTGTGKTAAFLITIFQKLLTERPKGGKLPRALVIAPTRELAVQIEEEAKQLGAHTGLSCAAVYGGVDYKKQADTVRRGVDIVVGTPGRLIDYMKQSALATSGVEILVIDEADRLLDMGFIRDLRFIMRRLPNYDVRQTMLFSATINFRVIEATYHYMKIPVEVSVTPEQITVEEVSQSLYHVEKKNKFRLLLGLIERIDTDRFLIFSNTKRGVNMVADRLNRNDISAQALSGDVPQRKRLKVVERFMKGEIDVVVATDVASRGLHIEDVGCVINYDLPQNPEDYVHRIGRTARAGKTGIAVSIVGEDDAYYLEPVESFIGAKIPFTMASADDLGAEKSSPPQKKNKKRSKRRGNRSYSSRSTHDTA